ncbi:MAG: hypothetical protein EBZ51_01215 [Synechococcaceae bacterium WB9_2_112]|nr:hypothetical protein [Synechococcaceae bacterium WB9_2_112]
MGAEDRALGLAFAQDHIGDPSQRGREIHLGVNHLLLPADEIGRAVRGIVSTEDHRIVAQGMGSALARGVMHGADVKPLELVVDITTDLLPQRSCLEASWMMEEVFAFEKIKQALAEWLGKGRHGYSSLEQGSDWTAKGPSPLVLT